MKLSFEIVSHELSDFDSNDEECIKTKEQAVNKIQQILLKNERVGDLIQLTKEALVKLHDIPKSK